MAKSLFLLSDEAWRALNPHLRRDRLGKPRVDDRAVISGILHVLKTAVDGATFRPFMGRRRRSTIVAIAGFQRRVWQPHRRPCETLHGADFTPIADLALCIGCSSRWSPRRTGRIARRSERPGPEPGGRATGRALMVWSRSGRRPKGRTGGYTSREGCFS